MNAVAPIYSVPLTLTFPRESGLGTPQLSPLLSPLFCALLAFILILSQLAVTIIVYLT